MVTVLTQKALVLWFTGAKGLSTPTHCPTSGRERLKKCFKALGDDVIGVHISLLSWASPQGGVRLWHIRMSLEPEEEENTAPPPSLGSFSCLSGRGNLSKFSSWRVIKGPVAFFLLLW